MRTRLDDQTWVEYDDAGAGKPVILLHAFPLSRAMWRPQLAALQNEWRVIAPDLPGFGGTSGFTAAPSVERMADGVAALLDALGVKEPVAVGGLSMGGYVALAFARRFPGRLRGLFLADTRAEADGAEARANRDRLIALTRARPVSEVFDQLLAKLVGDETRARRPQVVEEVRRIASAQTPEAVIAALQALRDRPNSVPHLSAIAVPALVLVGSDDSLTPPAVAETLAAGIAGSQLAVIQGAGHLANLEQPELFNTAVRTFLERLA